MLENHTEMPQNGEVKLSYAKNSLNEKHKMK